MAGARSSTKRKADSSDGARPPSPEPHVASLPGADLTEALDQRYDPDRKYREIDKPTPSPLGKYLEAVEKNPKVAGVVYAKLYEVNEIGGYRITTVSDAEFRARVKVSEAGFEKVRRIIESGLKLVPAATMGKAEIDARIAVRKAHLKEAGLKENFFDLEDDPTQTNKGATGFTEYTPIMGGPFSKQLYMADMLDAFAKAFEAYNHNPIAHQIVRITTCFALGRGVSAKACHPQCQERWDEWSKEAGLDARLESWSDTLSRDGELMLRTPKGQNQLVIRWIDPSTVWDIITDLEDFETGLGLASRGIIYYHQQYPTQYQLLYGGGQNSKFNPSDYESSKYIINQIPAEEVLHYKINVGPNEKRGRSDLFSTLGWLKRYKDFWTARVLRAVAQASFAWKNKIKGADTDVAAFISAFPQKPPDFGGVWVENEASDLQPMAVDIKGGDAKDDASGIRNMIAVGPGIPEQYLGFGEGHQARATAVVASEPGTKKFQARQILLGRVLRDIATLWGQAEIKSGRLPKQVPVDSSELTVLQRLVVKFGATPIGKAILSVLKMAGAAEAMEDHEIQIDFQFPEIAIEDRTAKIKDVDFSVSGGYISHEDGSTMIAKELGIEQYNYQETQAKIAQEEKERARATFNRPTPPPDQPQGPGGSGAPGGVGMAGASNPSDPQPKPTGALPGKDKRAIRMTHRS